MAWAEYPMLSELLKGTRAYVHGRCDVIRVIKLV